MRSDIPLIEKTTAELWQEVQELRTKLETHNHLTFGSQGLTGTINGILQSGNFVSGSSGWRISSDGNVEFDSGYFRGDISGATGTFTSAIAIGSGDNIFKADSNGIYLGNATFGSAPFRVSMAGILTCTGANIRGTLNVDDVNAGTLSVTYTQAKCTDANADQTSTHTANNASNYTGNAISTGYTAAKCTDANADQTSTHDCQHPGDYTASSPQSATWITAGTLTGSTVRTAASGNFRLEMRETNESYFPNALIWVSQANTDMAYLQGAIDGGLLISNQNESTQIALMAGTVRIKGDFKPDATNSHDLGSSTYSFATCFFGQTRAKLLYPASNDTYDLGTSSLKWQDIYLSGDIILPTNTADINGDLVPTTNDNFELGLSSSQKWYKVWAHYTGFGDVGFANNFRITEEEGNKEGLAIYNQHDKKIMVLDEDGNLWLNGKINPEIKMKTNFPFYKKIYSKEELKNRI